MRNFKESRIEKYRILEGDFGSPPGMQFGTFDIPMIRVAIKSDTVRPRTIARCWADDGGHTGWERVTVAIQDRVKGKGMARLPNLHELEAVKELFWLDGESVMLVFHSEQDQEHVKFPLHITLWKPRGQSLTLPPIDILG